MSYSHEDAEWLEALTTHLDPLGGDLDLWADTRLQAGDLWREEIETALHATHTAVFLVSPDFLKSRFIRECELPALLAEARRLIEECGYQRRDGELRDAEEAARSWGVA